MKWHGSQGNIEISDMSNKYLSNVAYALANGKARYEYIPIEVIHEIYAECARRQMFYNRYEHYLERAAVQRWQDANHKKVVHIDESFDRLMQDAINSAKAEFREDK